MQLGYDLAQELCVLRLDAAGNLLDEFGTDFAVLVAHRQPIEHRGVVLGGKVQRFGHGHLAGLTEAACSFELSAGNSQKASVSAMPKMHRHAANRGALAGAGIALSIMLGSCLAAEAAVCPRKGTLGTSRVLEVDAATFPQIGSKNFPQTLPLRDHEVVLTFDDGP